MHLKNQLSALHDEITEHAQHTGLGGNVFWAEQLQWWKRQSFVQPWPQNGLLQKEQLKQFESISRRSDSDSLPSNSPRRDAQKCGLREEGGTLQTALRALPGCHTSSYQMCFTPPYVTLHFCDCTHSCSQMAYFYTTFPTEISFCGQNLESEKDRFIVNWCSVLKNKQTDQTKKSNKKIEKASYGNTCKSRDLEAQDKTLSNKGHIPMVEL